MNTKQIDAVLELAKTLNFNRAAEKLCVSQPTLSYEIKELENEVGFKIFEGQNFSAKYSDNITIALPVRSMLKFLPQAIMDLGAKYPEVSISPKFIGFYNTDDFLRGNADVLVAMDFEVKHIPDIKIHPLYECGISLVMRDDDELAAKSIIHQEDLYGRTLMVGGGSPPALQRVQQRLIHTQKINYFNSADHDTTLTNVAAKKGICLSPDFFNEDTGGFKRIPFACPEKFKIVLCTHANDKRDRLMYFIKLLQKLHK